MFRFLSFFFFFFFNDTATTEIYTLSLHDALPICAWRAGCGGSTGRPWPDSRDRKSTRLNSSHQLISYAVFCLKKKKKKEGTGEERAKMWSEKREGRGGERG